MISDLEPYPATKDSGVKWLGEVPVHWGIRRLKHWLLTNQYTLAEDTDPDYAFNYLDIGSVGTGHLVAIPERLRFRDSPSRARRVVRPGDTIMSMVRTYLKAVWHANEAESDLIASTGFVVLTPSAAACPGFVSYLCQSEHFTNRVTANSIGVAYPAIAETKLKAFEIGVPSLAEQTAIARFLDHITSRIDRYIRAKQKLIALLEEQKQIIVHDAVTGRIDVRTGKPYSSYKPLGDEWLGTVPSHWDVLRLGKVINLTVGFPFKSEGFTQADGDIRLLRGINVAPGQLRWDDVVRWPASDMAKYAEFQLSIGDIILGMDRPIIGSGVRVAMVSEPDVPSLLLQRVARIRPIERRLTRKLAIRLLSGASFSDYLAPIFTGVSVPHLSPEQIRAFRIALPSLAEQEAIGDYLDSIADQTTRAASRARSQIALLREYRTRLIADVVTGKLDVRDAACELPNPGSNGAGNETIAVEFNPRLPDNALGKEANP